MQCPTCGFESPNGFAFCGKCGTRLVAACPQCGTENPPGFAFCGACGTRLAAAATPETLITTADLARLQRFLPSRQASDLPPPPLWKQDRLIAVHAQLDRLLETVLTYLPRHLTQTELAPGPVSPVGGTFLNGTLLFADISGFTALSERLSALGREGAEQITALVNQYFSAMLQVLLAHGGDLFKFGGDALLAFFPEQPDHPSSFAALQSAWMMREAMVPFRRVQTSAGSFPLQVKISLHRGPIFAARVGTPKEREFLITGPTVNATAWAEGLATGGQILISPASYDPVRDQEWLTVSQGPQQHYLVEHVAVQQIPSRPTARPASASAADTFLHTGEITSNSLCRLLDALERLTPYLPPGLLPRLASDPGGHERSGEHRLVAILFANFIGASEWITQMGADGAHEIAQALNCYFVTMHQAIARYGGVINKVDIYERGDKLMALFGAPVAHEDDAERAVRAALEMQAAVEQVNQNLPRPVQHQGLVQRIGLTTGLVFAGHVGGATRREYTVMGDEVNLAARLVSAAEEGEILLSNFVRRKVSPFFTLADRGQFRLKGKKHPVSLYTIVGRRARPEPVRGIRGLRSPLVGRAEEEATLRRLIADLMTGRGAILSLTGEAGLGKSRLVAELYAEVMDENSPIGNLSWIEGRCLSYTQQVSYSAFTEVMHGALQITDVDNDLDRWIKLRRRVDQLLPGEAGQDILPYLAHFLGLPLSDQDAERVAYLEGETLQRQILRAVTAFLESLAAERPLVLAFEDLHWADSASLALLERCLALTDRAPVLILLVYRPERTHGCWVLGQTAERDYPHRYTEIQLAPLDRDTGQDMELVRNLLSLERLPPTLAQLISRAEGNPFYVEEIIRTLIDQQAVIRDRDSDRWRLVEEADLRTIPDTLQEIIMARVDRLMEESRQTLQLASVIGRNFRHDVLAWLATAAMLAARLDASLVALQRAELVRERRRLPELEYGFKHVMIRDVAYESLLVRDRRTYHGLVAQHLEELYIGQKREEVYELLAHHYNLSDKQEKALIYLIKAGDKARTAYANPEAITFYRQATALAEELDHPQDRIAAETGMGDVLFHIGQYDDALTCFEKALSSHPPALLRADLQRRIGALYERRGDYEKALQAFAGGIKILDTVNEQMKEERLAAEQVKARLLNARCRTYRQQGQFETALADGQAALALLKGTTHYRELAQAHNELGNTYVRYSRPNQAIDHLEQGLQILERIGDEHGAASIYGNLAIIYYQTDLARSAAYFQRALETMQRLGNTWGESTALQNLGIIHYARADYGQAIQFYCRSLEMKQRLGDSLGIADCHVNLGEAYRAQGDLAQAIVHLERALSIAQEIGASDAEAECHRQLAECYLETRDLVHARTACWEALAHVQEIGDRKEEGLIYRVLGNVDLQARDPASALEHLRQSVEILHDLNREFDLGTARCDYAQALAELGETTAAREQLHLALELFQRLDLAQEQHRVQTALERLSQA